MRGVLSGDPAAMGGRGSYSIELDRLCHVVTRNPLREAERHVDAGGHAGGGDDLPLLDDPLVRRLCAEFLQAVERQPVTRRPEAAPGAWGNAG